jgi:hypothetical protein
LEANLVADDSAIAAELTECLDAAMAQSSRRLQPIPVRATMLKTVFRSLGLTIALTALRVFVAFSRTGFRIR